MYDHEEIEPKWQKYWEQSHTFKVENNSSKEPFYVLDMFPYPSGAGLHVGHPEGMTANDIVARYKATKGYNVLHPMGWDAFGLPAENYAIKTGTHPRITTDQNIANFRKQIKALGFSYDWDREVDTTDPDYYKWTQWIFLKLFEKGLAYEQNLPINYCPSCKTGLANEEVLKDFSCERCGTKVEKKKIRQWVLAITQYAERLLNDVDKLDWPDSIKQMQRNWIGKSEGCDVAWQVDGHDNIFHTYTTTVDTIYGVTFAVISPEHDEVLDIVEPSHLEGVQKYMEQSRSKSDLERTELNKDKTGIFTGSYLINPLSGDKTPLYVADYVLMSYGTGVVMGVPAHDQRDMDFAHKYDIDIVQSIQSDSGESLVYDDLDKYNIKGTLVDSGEFTGMDIIEARKKITQHLADKNLGKKKINYKLRDWLFSRQRYWGEPIPLVHCEECGIVGEKEENLPILLPDTDNFEPSGDGTSPLSQIEEFVNCECPKCGGPGKRETNTMPQWGGSCWYYLRYMDPNNSEALVDPEVEKYWGQVDSYVGGAEHAVLHLLYARFWHKFLFDIGVVSSDEPFHRLRNQGLILAHAYERENGGLLAVDLVEEKDGRYYEIETGEEVKRVVAKMSKSLKNVVNPDDIVEQYGADSLRLYEMYMADFKDTAPWDSKNINGVRRFLEKSERLFTPDAKISSESDEFTMKLVHKTIKKIEEDIENYKFNTSIAQMMILVNNGLPKDDTLQTEWKSSFARILHPFAPHLAEELWEALTPTLSLEGEGVSGEKHMSIFHAPWPEYDEAMTIDNTITIGVQVLGKLRGEIEITKDEDKDSVLEKAKTNENVVKFIDGKAIIKEIYVPGKIVNLVIK